MLLRRNTVEDFSVELPCNISNLTLQIMNCLAGFNAESSEGDSLSDRQKASWAGLLGSKAQKERRLQEKERRLLFTQLIGAVVFIVCCVVNPGAF